MRSILAQPEIWTITPFVVLASLWSSSYACSVSGDYLVPSIAERTTIVDHIAVIEVDESSDLVRVSRWLKGHGPSEIEVSPEELCNPIPRHLENVLVFLVPRESDNEYRLLRYGFWSGAEEANGENIKAVQETMRIGLEEYLRTQGRRIVLVGVIEDEHSGAKTALLRLPNRNDVIRVQAGDVIHETTSRIVAVNSEEIEIEMVTGPMANLSNPIILKLTLE